MPSYTPIKKTLSNDRTCRSGEGSHQNVCKTMNLVDDFYQCQIHRFDCEYSFTFGISYLCESPQRHEYSERNAPLLKPPSQYNLLNLIE